MACNRDSFYLHPVVEKPQSSIACGSYGRVAPLSIYFAVFIHVGQQKIICFIPRGGVF
jgi:hypothetical protein